MAEVPGSLHFVEAQLLFDIPGMSMFDIPGMSMFGGTVVGVEAPPSEDDVWALVEGEMAGVVVEGGMG